MTVLKPARKLFEYLRPKAVLKKAHLSHFSKLGDPVGSHRYHLVGNEQGKFVAEYGVALENMEFTLTENEAFEKLAAFIAAHKKVRLHLLWLANRGVLNCAVDIYHDVVMRVIEYYEIRSDEVLTRYDVLVEVLA